jgi:ubiquinone/menaquinone biosynthesis C-methylase UbiE
MLADNILAYCPKKGMCLEIGCGDGYLSYNANSRGLNAVGVDISVNRCLRAKRNVPDSDFIVADATALPFKKHFDVVLCSQTLEHIRDVKHALNEAYEVLKEGAFYILTVPYKERLTPNVQCPFCLKRFLASMYIHSFDEMTLKRFLINSGFFVKSICIFGNGLAYNRFTVNTKIGRIIARLIDKFVSMVLKSGPYLLACDIKKKMI